VAGPCEHGHELSGSGATELVVILSCILGTRHDQREIHSKLILTTTARWFTCSESGSLRVMCDVRHLLSDRTYLVLT
jgi:hypothetical protein